MARLTLLAAMCSLSMVSAGPSPAVARLAPKKELELTSQTSMNDVHVIADHLEPNGLKEDEDLEKRAASDDNWKRAGGAYINTLQNALGTMQRPRFGKRYPYYDSDEEGYYYPGEKRGKSSLLEMESALSSLQRPRFGRSAAAMKSRVSRR